MFLVYQAIAQRFSGLAVGANGKPSQWYGNGKKAMRTNKKKYCQNNRIVSLMLNNKHTTKTIWPSVGKKRKRIYLKYDTYFTGIKYFRQPVWY